MSDLKELLDREARRVDAASDALESVLRRGERKRRNQRITAGVVGIAVFVAAIWVVTTGLSFQSQTDSIPGGAGATRPAETGPTATQTEAPAPDWDGEGLPPEGTALSSPTEGQLIGEVRAINQGFAYVYADGRVISYATQGTIVEQRLTPEAADLVRSGAIQLDLAPPWVSVPADAWVDAERRPYAPPRYAVCYGDPGGYEDPSRVLRLLPPPAEAILRGKVRTYRPESLAQEPGFPGRDIECFEVTTQEARALDQILEEAGFQAGVEAFFGFSRGPVSFEPILPHGTLHFWGG